MATFWANEINATDRDVTGPSEQVQIECVRCHAIKYKIKNYATGQSQKL